MSSKNSVGAQRQALEPDCGARRRAANNAAGMSGPMALTTVNLEALTCGEGIASTVFATLFSENWVTHSTHPPTALL